MTQRLVALHLEVYVTREVEEGEGQVVSKLQPGSSTYATLCHIITQYHHLFILIPLTSTYGMLLIQHMHWILLGPVRSHVVCLSHCFRLSKLWQL